MSDFRDFDEAANTIRTLKKPIMWIIKIGVALQAFVYKKVFTKREKLREGHFGYPIIFLFLGGLAYNFTAVICAIITTLLSENSFGILSFVFILISIPLKYIVLIFLVLKGLSLRDKKIQKKRAVKLSSEDKAESPSADTIKSPSATNITLPIQSIEPHGVIFGRKDNYYIVKPEELDGHVLVVGGVGSGKSSCIAIPTLRNWNESVFAIDIKGELYDKSKDNRPNIKVFNPLDDNSYGYDPFSCLYASDNPSQEARAIAQAIIPLPPDTRDPFWIESAQNIFTAAILHYSAQNLSFLDTIKEIQSITPKALIHELCESSVLEARYCVNSLADMEDRTLSSIMAELSRNIVHFVTDKNLSFALSRENNITPEDLEYGNDVFINIPEHLLRQWKNLLTLIVNQFLTHFEQRSEANARPILFLLDEFPRLGKVSAMLDGLATLRSKKIIICLIIQSLAQLDTIYGQNERKVISDTCAYKAILGATDADTQEYFSRLVGTFDKLLTSHGTNSEFLGLPKGTSTNTQEQEKRIIKPHEFGMLNDIVLLTPFAIPFENPSENKNESLVEQLLNPNIMNIFSSSPKTPEISVSFVRVDKAPFYKEE